MQWTAQFLNLAVNTGADPEMSIRSAEICSGWVESGFYAGMGV